MATQSKPVEEMTRAEYVAHLEEESKKQAEHNAEMFEKQAAAFAKAKEKSDEPAKQTPDEIRAENAKAVEAETAAATAKAKPAAPKSSPTSSAGKA